MRTAAIAIKNSQQNIVHFEEREVLKLTEQKHAMKNSSIISRAGRQYLNNTFFGYLYYIICYIEPSN